MDGTLDWDEFRLVKAIADSGSLVGAADKLGVNHSTVFRRLTALEAAIGVRLFERSRSAYQPTAAGEAMINVASDVGESIVEFERNVARRDIKPAGVLRVTTIDSLAIYVLPPILNLFRETYPGVALDIILSSQDLSLSRRGAEVALRVTHGPSEIHELLEANGLHPSRALGQNFVADANTVRRIVRLAGVGPGSQVVEIGAGLGSLTLALAEAGAEVTAVEVDRHVDEYGHPRWGSGEIKIVGVSWIAARGKKFC